MLTEKSLSTLIKFVSIGHVFKFAPLKWDSELKKLVEASSILHKLFPYVGVLVSITASTYTGSTYEIKSKSDLIMVLFLGLCGLPALIAVVWISWKQVEVVAVLNGTLHLNDQHRM